jgi:erythromycin esterase-like protein
MTAEIIASAAEPLPPIDDPAFAEPIDRFGDARVVLLGEASHGTSEFYRARAAITRRLIERHGFGIVAVEADWPDAASIDRLVRHKPEVEDGEPAFERFPRWMWRNTDVAAFTAWLREHNTARAPAERAGFYGLDLYNLSASMQAVIDYLDRVDPDAAKVARQRYACLRPYRHAPERYGAMAYAEGFGRCEEGVVNMLADLFARGREHALADDEALLDAAQNARLVAGAEAYYRAMYYGSAESWNLRDRHMFDTLDLLLASRGPDAKAVVWAHNSHIGDARATEMGRARGELNLGQLCRESYGERARLVGFGTHTGTVAAASDWDAPMQVMRVNPSRPDSVERLAHDTGLTSFFLDLRGAPIRDALAAPRLERFIGVIYRPDTERWSHYAEVVLPEQLDAYVWLDETNAVTPLDK